MSFQSYETLALMLFETRYRLESMVANLALCCSLSIRRYFRACRTEESPKMAYKDNFYCGDSYALV